MRYSSDKLAVRAVVFEWTLASNEEDVSESFRLHFTAKTPSDSENHNPQSDKKDILTNNQDKKYFNSMKHLKGQHFRILIHQEVYCEWS